MKLQQLCSRSGSLLLKSSRSPFPLSACFVLAPVHALAVLILPALLRSLTLELNKRT
jgi:hypothetical protein